MIQVSNLTKLYGTTRAIDNLSFHIEPGRIYGFLGPNGAGKSTTMNIMTGCLAASWGTVTVGGHDIYADALAAKRLIGYLPEMPPVYPDMTPAEYLAFVARAKGVDRRDAKGQIGHALEATALEGHANRLIAHLSRGYRQRVGIAQAILGEPAVVILDEPTVGLDPQQIIDIRRLIVGLGKRHTVILSSHILSEVRAVCDSVLILAGGRIAAFDTLENLEAAAAGPGRLELLVRDAGERLTHLLDSLDFLSGYRVDRSDGTDTCALRVEARDGGDIRERLFFAFAAAGIPILELTAPKADLEQVFLRLTAPDHAPDEPPSQEASDPSPHTPTEGGRER